jgi:Flp pilus assembly CpaE family ATPase
MSTEAAADPTPADRDKTKRTRRALPITKRVARNGKVSYALQIDSGTKPDGSRDRRRYTYTTMAEAKRDYARIITEAAAGTLVRRDKAAFLTEWLDRRRVRANSSTATAQASSRLSNTSAQCRYST